MEENAHFPQNIMFLHSQSTELLSEVKKEEIKREREKSCINRDI